MSEPYNDAPEHSGLARNVRLYPWFQALGSFEAWIPIFFLFFSSYLSLAQVIQLSVVYYATVFVLEVPSGYCSDRFGRRATLLFAAAARVVACVLFITADGFFQFATAQLFMGIGSAFRSGGNTALHYDSLDGLSRREDFAQREAIAHRYALFSLCLAALLGGLSGFFDLRWPYVLTMLASIGSLLVARQFVEPVASSNRAESFRKNITVCIGRLRDPVLSSLLALTILMYALEHVPFELYQAYISVLEDAGYTLISTDTSPILSGIVLAISMIGGVIGAALSVRVANRIGLWGTLITATAIQILVVVVLATWLHPLCLALVFVRNLPGALVHAPVNATIAPRIAQQERATYLSIQNMGNKLGFGILLFAMSQIAGTAELDWPKLQEILRSALFIGVAAVAILGIMRLPLARSESHDKAM